MYHTSPLSTTIGSGGTTVKREYCTVFFYSNPKTNIQIGYGNSRLAFKNGFFQKCNLWNKNIQSLTNGVLGEVLFIDLSFGFNMSNYIYPLASLTDK